MLPKLRRTFQAKFTTLQMAFKQHKLSEFHPVLLATLSVFTNFILGLYCDGSAFEWVTKYQEGPEKDQPLVAPDFPNKGIEAPHVLPKTCVD